MRTLKWVGIGLGLAVLGGVAAYAQYREAIEEPAYRVASSEKAFELREYAPMIVAEVTHTGERGRALNAGFRRLAAYIFAQDRPGAGEGEEIAMTAPVMQAQGEPIAMTAPVLQDAATAGTWRTRFVMPASYTLDSLPAAPSDISLAQVPARRVAAVRFRGWGRAEDLAEAETALREWMASKGLEPVGAAEYAFYDPPMVPGPLRRNEVLIAVR